MLYIKDDGAVYYYIAEPVGDIFYDIYNFHSMNRTEEALQPIIKWTLELFELKGVRPSPDWKYTLILDFLANTRIPRINELLNRLVEYLNKGGFKYEIVESPLQLQIINLDIKDVLSFIQDNKFQSLNSAVASLSCSVWRLHFPQYKAQQ